VKSVEPIRLITQVTQPKSFQEVDMTTITYGSSSFSNAKTRRHERRKAAAIERDTVGNIIDSIFGLSTQNESQKALRKVASRVDKAVNGTLTLRPKREESGGMCLPEVAIFNAGHRKSENITAR